jgi:hypothetical protein
MQKGSHCRGSLELITTAFVLSCLVLPRRKNIACKWLSWRKGSMSLSRRNVLDKPHQGQTLPWNPPISLSTNNSCLWILRTCLLLPTFIVSVSMIKGLPLSMIQHVSAWFSMSDLSATASRNVCMLRPVFIEKYLKSWPWQDLAFPLPQCSHNLPHWSHEAHWLVHFSGSSRGMSWKFMGYASHWSQTKLKSSNMFQSAK